MWLLCGRPSVCVGGHGVVLQCSEVSGACRSRGGKRDRDSEERIVKDGGGRNVEKRRTSEEKSQARRASD